jgi:hypothetical protein
MKIPSGKVIAINAVLISIMIGSAYAGVKSLFGPPDAEVCSKRYNVVSAMAFERGGALISGVDLQASAAGQDLGVIQNVSVRRAAEGPSKTVMGIRIPAGDSDTPKGVSFPWSPRVLQGKTAGCLSYHAFIPQDFALGTYGGSLPGLVGTLAASDDKPGNAVRVWPMWTHNGGAALVARAATGGDDASSTPYSREGVEFPRGRWVSIEQEVVLNTPNEQNGLIRLWLDGQLVVEKTDLKLRSDANVRLAGVAANVHYGYTLEARVPPQAKAPTIWFSPFEVRASN